MAGRGFASSDPTRRVHRSAAEKSVRTFQIAPCPQPSLPWALPGGDEWPKETLAWWDNWGEQPQAAEFSATDWDALAEAAVLHARFWQGDLKVAAELRLRVAKFGATAEDRARLRIQFASADKAEADTPNPVLDRFSHLRVVE